MLNRKSKIYPLSLAAVMGALALTIAGKAGAQEFGPWEDITADYNAEGFRKSAQTSSYSIDYRLGLMIEQELVSQQPFAIRYYSLPAFWEKLRTAGTDSVWSKNNYAFLSKPPQERTGEGLIPDIQIPIPGLGKAFGSGAQIKVSGNQKITAGYDRTTYNQIGRDLDANATTDDNKINIKQEQRVNLEGVIGDRVHVLIDYDSEAEIDKRSKVRLRYEGQEDEVLQSLEAGDTEFSLSGSSLVGGLTTVHKGLFGLKGVARLGGFELTAIASKDEGQNQTNTFSGSNVASSVTHPDNEFMQYTVYEIIPGGLAGGDAIEAIKVYIKSGNDYVTPNAIPHYLKDRSWRDFRGIARDTIYGPVKMDIKTEITDFILDNPVTGRIILTNGIYDQSVLGVAYKTKNGGYYPSKHDFDNSDTLMLVKPANCQPPDSINGYCWNYEKRNYYSLNGRGIDFSTLTIKLQYRKENEWLENDLDSQKTFLELLFLESDGNLNDYYINQEEGYFSFPQDQPFLSPALPDSCPDIYRVKNLTNYSAKFRFLITYKSTVAMYALNAPGRLLEGTVSVTLNGSPVSSSEYTVDYDMGTVTFNDRIKTILQGSSAALKIDYQYLPSFALGSKTLAGLRGIYKFGESGQLGGTWLYRSEQTPDEKPRLGEEPRRIIVAGLDGSYQAAPDFLTSWTNALPLVETEAPSNFKLTGEIAGNFPNPNTKGQVYIDDMDGSKVSDEFNLSRSAWVRTSVPPGKTDTMLARTFYWYNPTTQATMKEINPAITDETQRNETIRTLRLIYEAGHQDTLNSWAGVTQLLSKTGLDLSQSKLLNLWIRGLNSKGIVHIDIGRNIDEDQVWWTKKGLHPQNNKVDCEPLNLNREPVLMDAHDIGLDRVKGNDSTYLASSGDDGADDYVVDITKPDYSKINGTEGNGYYDTEDLKMNGLDSLDVPQLGNNYYTFRFDLSKSDTNAYGWHQLSALLDTAQPVGPQLGWSSIQYARIWVDSCPASTAFEIAMVEVSGNRWQEEGVFSNDTLDAVASSEKFTIEVKNNRDNPDYSLPPNTEQKDDQGRVEFEQSLVFNIDSLGSGHYVKAWKILRDKENNYTGYKTLKIWAHSNDTTRVRKSFALRLIGNDPNSYYQYKQTLSSGWQEMIMDVLTFSDLKKLPFPTDTTNKIRTSGNYSLKGNPSLKELNGIALCIFNDDTGRIFSDEVWFDELRLDDVRRDRGTAIASSASINFADLLSLNAAYNKTGSHWYGIDTDGTGSGVKNISYSLNGSLNAHKLYLERLGLALPVGFRYGESQQYGEYGADDIRLTEEESRAQRAFSRNAGFDVSFSKSMTQWWLTNLTIDRISPRFNWSRSVSDSRTTADSNTSTGLSLGYGWSSGEKKSFKTWPGWQFYYLPSSLGLGWSRNQTQRWYWDKLTGVKNNNGSGETRNGQGQLSWQLMNSLSYSFNTTRNLKDRFFQGEWARKFGLGSETSRSQRVNYSTTLGWLKVIKPSLAFSTQYSEGHSLAAKPSIVDTFHLLNVSNSNSLSLNSSLEVGKWLAKVTGWRNKARDDSAEVGSPRWLVTKIDYLFNKLGGVQASFSRDNSSQASNLLMRRPDLLYQFGLKQQVADIPRYFQASADRNTIRNSYSLGTSLELMRLSLNLSFRRSDDTIIVGDAQNSSRSVTWPELRATLAGLERWGLWKKTLTSASLTSSYSRTIDKTWENQKALVRISTKNNFSPILSMSGRWKKNISTSLAFDYSSQKNDDIIGQGRDTYNQTFKTSSSVSYSFSAPKGFKLNLWKLGKKRIKFNSELSLASLFGYSIIGARNEIPEGEIAALKQLLAETSYEKITELGYTSLVHSFTMSPSAKYNFTRSITGSASVDYSFTKDKIARSNNSDRTAFNASVEIKF